MEKPTGGVIRGEYEPGDPVNPEARYSEVWAAGYFGVEVKTLRAWSYAGKIRRRKLGRENVYLGAEILAAEDRMSQGVA